MTAVFFWIIGIVVVVGIIWLISVFNTLVRKRNTVHTAWSDIDVQLKRRFDLVPNLVETVKGYKEYEVSVLEQVTAARTNVMAAQQGGGVVGRAMAEGDLTQALRGLFIVAENYPELRASESFLHLQQQLSSLEHDIQSARRYYNAAVREFNNALQVFPTLLVAGLLGFRSLEFFGAADAERDVVSVTV